MQFINPQLWWLGLLAIVPIVLYLFRRRSKTVPVSSLVFFKALAREHQESEWLRRLKRLISLILSVLLVAGAVAALVRIVFSPVTDDTRNVVILLDRSASMAATDAAGKSRLEVAKSVVRNRLEGLSEIVGVSLIAYDGRSEILQPRTFKRRSILTALDQIQVRPISHDLDAAFATAQTLAKLETPAEIWHVSDSPPESLSLATGQSLVSLPVGLENATNVGFTAFQIRKLPLQSSRFTAFLQIALNDDASEPVEGNIEVRVGSAFLAPRSFELEPGKSTAFEIPIDGATEQLLQLTIHVENDALPLDNAIVVPLPDALPVMAARVGPKDSADPFTHLALQSLVKEGELLIWSIEPEKWPIDDIDVAIFDNWLPEEWPEDVPAIVINPPGNLGPIKSVPLQGTIPHRDIRVTNEMHPLLFRVSSSRLALTQTCIFDTRGSLEPLWFAGNEPVLAAGAVNGQRLVVMGFAPQLSERLPLTASFPLLMGNAIYWCAEGDERAENRLQERKTGDVVNIVGSRLRWTELSEGKLTSSAQNLDRNLAELDRIGVWESGEGQRGTAHLLSREETNLRNQGAPDSIVSEAVPTQNPPGGLLGDLTWLILSIVLVILLLESLLFHWFAVY